MRNAGNDHVSPSLTLMHPSPATAPTADVTRLPALDGLRAFAALLVVLTHAAFLTAAGSTTGLLGHLLARGDFGVSLFFALSGFLLYRLLVRERAGTGRVRVFGYFLRRFARVIPAYWLTLIVLMVAVRPEVRDVVLHALGLQIYVADSTIAAFGQSWSIATELSFYLVLPGVVLGLTWCRRFGNRWPMRVLLTALVITSLLGFLVEPAALGEQVILERWLPWRAPHFLVGMILAEATVGPGSSMSRWLRRAADDSGACVAVAGATYLVSTTPLAGSLLLQPAHGLELVLRTAFATVFAGALLLPLALGRPSLWSRSLSVPTVRWVGAVSYGLFLWHLPVFEALYHLTDAPFFRGGLVPLLVVGLPVSLFLAFLSHQFLELPAARFAARLTRGPRDGERQEQSDSHAQLEPRRAE